MKKAAKKYSSLNNNIFYVFVLLTVLVPVSYSPDFVNKFDLIKVSALYIFGSIFIILSSFYFINEIKKGNFTAKFGYVKTLDILILIFLFSAAISSVFSSNPFVSYTGTYERQMGFLFYLFLILIYFLSAVFINDSGRLIKIVFTMESVSFVASLIAISGYLGYDPLNLTPENSLRAYTFIGHPVFSAGFITLIFPASLLNISQKKNRVVRIIFPLVMLLAVISSLTRTAYIAMTVEILLVLIFLPAINKLSGAKLKKYFSVSIFTTGIIVICVFAFIYFFPDNGFVKRIVSITSLTNQPRWHLWRDSIKMFFHYPLTGTGPGLFSRVFENYSSYDLKLSEIKGFFDHAHNNFINTFCTMGITGGLSYISILLYVIISSCKMIFRKIQDKNINLFFLFTLCSFSGYFVFGLADFDDISILFYLFVLISIFKSKYLSSKEQYFSIGNNRLIKRTGFVFFTILILFSSYTIYSTVFNIYADYNFSKGTISYNSGRFNEFINYFNKAISLRPDQPQYRFTLGNNLLMYSSSHKEFPVDKRDKLLFTAKDEINKAINNCPYRLICLSNLSMIELELGNEAEANKIKTEIFKTDTCQFVYRINLATYYLNHDRDDEAIKEIDLVLKYDIKNTDALSAKAFYVKKAGKFEETAQICRRILEINPKNKFANEMISWLNKNKTATDDPR